MTEHPLVIVVGPTGSGKSNLALDLAETFSGEIVNCDSLQLYRGFDIGTAKTPVPLRRGIPHHLLDALDAEMVHSAGDYSRLARAVVADIAGRGRLPVMAGGTGFYVKAFLDGLPVLPARDADLRTRLTAREQRRPGSLHRILARLDPAAASRTAAADTQKLTRSLEIRMLTGTPLPPAESAQPLSGFDVLQIGLDPPREALTSAIARRTQAMFDAGLIDEVRDLLAHGLTGDEKPFESLGYKEALAVTRGEMTVEQAVEATEIGTRQYAKRQRTWFRRDARIHWIEGFGTEPAVVAAAIADVKLLLCRHPTFQPNSQPESPASRP